MGSFMLAKLQCYTVHFELSIIFIVNNNKFNRKNIKFLLLDSHNKRLGTIIY